MKTIIATLLICLSGFSSAQSLDSTFDVALGAASLTTQTARYDSDLLRFFSTPEFPSLIYQEMHANPWRAPFIANAYRSEMTAAVDNQADLLGTGARMMGFGVRRTLLGDPIDAATKASKRPNALPAVLDKMKTAGLFKGTIPSLAKVPSPVQEAIALILQVAMDSAPMRRAAFAKVDSVEDLYKRSREALPEEPAPEAAIKEMRDMDAVDLKYLCAGGQDLAMAVGSARTTLFGVSRDEEYSWRISTAWGDIVANGNGAQQYGGEPMMLIIDTGGDDQYIGLPSNRSTSNWLSIVIDTNGNDQYLSSKALANTTVTADTNRAKETEIGPGSANLGYSFLYDVKGNDLYRTTRPGIAASQYGMATVCDSDGDDTYDAYFFAEGAANFGYALLEDLGGTDHYTGFNSVQGYGGVGGFGALIDRGGDDTYIANDTAIDFPSPQSGEHNVSLAQGAGYGRRADYLDGHSLSGGVGVLYDLEGNDKYSCGVFGQGVGYWESCGFLWDRQGNDQYNGQWYVQGSAAHFAIGYLEDENGEDTYTAGMNMALGAGHDFSTGIFVDRNGNDHYKAPNLSLGAGNANGIGIFLDFQGNDVYETLGLTLGRAAEATKGTLRERCLCLGLFYDGAGEDTYPASTNWARNAARIANWTDRLPIPQESQLGIFWDR